MSATIHQLPASARRPWSPSLDGVRLAFVDGFPVVEFKNGNLQYADLVPPEIVLRLLAAYGRARQRRDFPHQWGMSGQ